MNTLTSLGLIITGIVLLAATWIGFHTAGSILLGVGGFMLGSAYEKMRKK